MIFIYMRSKFAFKNIKKQKKAFEKRKIGLLKKLNKKTFKKKRVRYLIKSKINKDLASASFATF